MLARCVRGHKCALSNNLPSPTFLPPLSPSCLFFLSVPFARCDIALIQPKHVERSGISPGISGRGKTQLLSLSLSVSVRSLRRCQTRAACVVEQRGLLGMNVVSATFDPESC